MLDVLQRLLDVPWVFCDTETTGLTPAKHRIWEICLHRYEVRDGERKPVQLLSTIINPSIQLDDDLYFTRPEGITGDVLRASWKWEKWTEDIEAACKGAVFFAHNAPFDIRFIEAEQRYAGRPSPIEAVVCTQQLSKKLLPGKKSYALGNLIASLGILPKGELHRAQTDTEAMMAIFVNHLLPSLGESQVQEVIRYCDMEKHSPAFLEAA